MSSAVTRSKPATRHDASHLRSRDYSSPLRMENRFGLGELGESE